MKKTLFPIILFSLIIAGCAKDKSQNPFAVKKHGVGLINDSTQIKDLKTIFSNDSISNYKEDDSFTGRINTIEIFEKGSSNPLLVITPTEALDSTATISSIRLIDSRYKTDKNISVISTFKDIKEAYKINKITNLINSVLVSVNELDATFTIDKKELPANMRYDLDLKIDAIQIPDDAKLKFFMVHF
ncbi:hypothetical protein [Winogradskyella immobilis]|uniref:Lipoprotein n=1 Tax=Winogradskyella immobilis TaxID=2816852 RepID=A0ABS8ESJ3_9FLAO|nr:hypothetical protein [Winogradskyella immobilis]MCC1485495.1 hypothetical protein [Winogradskyella immobilis]MCG0017587.1 hypothetical protein [Winogradskyella immobilis]